MTNRLYESRRTPIDTHYGSCKFCYVSLVIYLNSSTNIVTSELGLTPSFEQNKGQKLTNSRNKTRIAKNTYWLLSSENHITSKDLRHHLDWLLTQLKTKYSKLLGLQRQEGVIMAVNCVWWGFGSGGPTLWPEQMAKLADLNLECSFSIYMDD